jgi:exodeoxyribonuclease VII large subunit
LDHRPFDFDMETLDPLPFTPPHETPPDEVLSVSRLTARIREILEGALPPLWVEGEVSNHKPATSGHLYFTLKDDKAQVQAVMYRSWAETLRFRLENGMKVLGFGQVTVYAPRGNYQIRLTRIRPSGVGELQLAFEQLKARLAAEGLFEQSRKRRLPFLPRRIGIVTSPSGAAIRDLITVLTRRSPGIHVVLAPVKVQGAGASEEIADGIRRLNALDAPALDVLIVGRGGGSLEDLWAFNEEAVARAVAGSRLPVVSAVGHEVDFTISDFVADVRAPTPSAAAEIVVPERDVLATRVRERLQRMQRSLERRMRLAREAFARLATRTFFRRPRELVDTHAQRIDELIATVAAAMRRILSVKTAHFTAAVNRLEPLSPLRTLARGYAIVTRRGSDIPLVDPAGLVAGERLDVRLAGGRVGCRVDDTDPEAGPIGGGAGGRGAASRDGSDQAARKDRPATQGRLPGF